MFERKLPPPTCNGVADHYRRLGELNRQAWVRSLRAMTQRDAAQLFEELAEGFPELPFVRLPKPAPVVLFKIWKP